jgi:chromosome partitioning protein
MFLPDDRIEEIWSKGDEGTLLDAMKPLLEGTGDIQKPFLEEIKDNLHLLAGNLGLSGIEDELSLQWNGCLNSNISTQTRSFKVVTAFYRIAKMAALEQKADIVLFDVGPNLGALNRCALISTDCVVIPMGADLFSLQGLTNLGPALKSWRKDWTVRLNSAPEAITNDLPEGAMHPIGYVVMQHGIKEGRPVKSYLKWANRIPDEYRRSITNEPSKDFENVEDDKYCLALLKHYHSLMPMAMEARKPIFLLKPADGAIGAHVQAVNNSYDDFRKLATKIISKIKVKNS